MGKFGFCIFKNNRYMYVMIYVFMVFIVVYKNICLYCVVNRYFLNWWCFVIFLYWKLGICRWIESYINWVVEYIIDDVERGCYEINYKSIFISIFCICDIFFWERCDINCLGIFNWWLKKDCVVNLN